MSRTNQRRIMAETVGWVFKFTMSNYCLNPSRTLPWSAEWFIVSRPNVPIFCFIWDPYYVVHVTASVVSSVAFMLPNCCSPFLINFLYFSDATLWSLLHLHVNSNMCFAVLDSSFFTGHPCGILRLSGRNCSRVAVHCNVNVVLTCAAIRDGRI